MNESYHLTANRFLQQHRRVLEIMLLMLLLAAFLGSLQRVLSGRRNFTGDTEQWYVLYHYFHESLRNSTLPLWNPYMNGGEPFWPVISMWRLLDPLNLVCGAIGALFHIPIFTMYHVYFICMSLFMLGGEYLLLRHLFVRHSRGRHLFLLNLLLVICLAHVAFTRCLSDAYVYSLYHLPYVLYFLIRFIEEDRARHLYWLAYFLGLYVGTAAYHFIFGIFFLVCFLLAMLLTNLHRIRVLAERVRKQAPHLALALLCVVFLSLPMIATYKEASTLYPIARTCLNREFFESQNALTSQSTYDLVTSNGWYPALGDVIAFLFTDYPFFDDEGSLGRLLQHPLPILLVPLFLMGMLSRPATVWTPGFQIGFLVSLFTVLGPQSDVHRFLCDVFPPLRLIRNGGFFLCFMTLCCSFFVLSGASRVGRTVGGWLRRSEKIRKALLVAVEAALAVLIAFSLLVILEGKGVRKHTTSRQAYFPDFDHQARRFEFPERRVLAIPRTAWYLMEPILYKQHVALQMLAVPPADLKEDETPYFRAWSDLRAENRCPACYGLRTLFWTHNYHTIYLLGERDLEVFKALMGVDRPILELKEFGIFVEDKNMARWIATIGGSKLRSMLDQVVLIHDHPKRTEGFRLVGADFELPKQDAPAHFSYRVTRYKPDRIDLRVTSDRGGMLVFRDGYHRDWKAYMDGKKVPLHRVNVGFKAISLPSGHHQIVFVYLPVFYVFAVCASVLLSLSLPLLICLFGRRGPLLR